MDDPRSLYRLSNRSAGRLDLVVRWFNALLPPHCILCRRTGWPAGVCDGCIDTLPFVRHTCQVCASELLAAGVCGACLSRPPAFDETLAVFRYESPIDRLIQSLKYGHDLTVADALGQLMAARSSAIVFDRMIPVPLHRRRLAERGFNQSWELGRAASRLHGCRMSHDLVQRARETTPQAGLKLKARRRNLRGAFEIAGRLDGETVLVVDDVMTSGATLDRLAEALKAAGAARVINLVCARTPAGR